MLVLEAGFSEGALGFPKFSRFLRQAHDHGVVVMNQGEGGSFQVALGTTDGIEKPFPEASESTDGDSSSASRPRERTHSRGGRGARDSSPPVEVPVSSMDFPTGRDAVIQYLTAYDGVGQKTAETLVDAFGNEKVFGVFDSEPARVQEYLTPGRAEKVLEAWRADLALRRAGTSPAAPEASNAPTPPEVHSPKIAFIAGFGGKSDSGKAGRSSVYEAATASAAAPVSGVTPKADETPISEEASASDEAPAKSWGRRPRRTRSSGE
jgi:hypothetical protein